MSFPDPRTADGNGLLCMGGDLSPDLLIEAYSRGIFPWPQEGVPLLWFSPPERGILKFSNFHIPKSFKKEMAKSEMSIVFDKDFSRIIESCARVPRDGETGTWILPEMIKAYETLFEQGYVHCVGAWLGEELVGGLYGVFVKGVFSGESMFFQKSGASKLCLVHMVERLKEIGVEWMDIQMVTPVLKNFGGEYISRTQFLVMLEKAQKINNPWEKSL